MDSALKDRVGVLDSNLHLSVGWTISQLLQM